MKLDVEVPLRTIRELARRYMDDDPAARISIEGAEADVEQVVDALPDDAVKCDRGHCDDGDCDLGASLIPSTAIPGDDPSRGEIDNAIAWARTGRGGRNFDLLVELERSQAEQDGNQCDSEYGLCE